MLRRAVGAALQGIVTGADRPGFDLVADRGSGVSYDCFSCAVLTLPDGGRLKIVVNQLSPGRTVSCLGKVCQRTRFSGLAAEPGDMFVQPKPNPKP